MEEKIKEMGYAFRDITYHSDGRYSCRLGDTFLEGKKGTKEFWADTPSEAIEEALKGLEEIEKDFE